MENMGFDEVLIQCISTLRSGKDMDKTIGELLVIIAKFYDADRSYIFEFDRDQVFMDNTYEYCKEGVTPEKDMLQGIEITVINRWLELFEESGEVYVNSTDEELSKDSEEYRILKERDIDSIMIAPLYLDNRLMGFMGVDNPNNHVDTLLLLRAIAILVANDIQKRKTIDQKVIEAIAGTYVSMYLINLPQDFQREYNSNADVRHYEKKEKHAYDYTKHLIKKITAPAHLDAVLEFVDFDTLSARMAHTDYISHEFVNADGKWCRANFTIVERREDGAIENVIFGVQEIDEEKRKELEYQAALEQALENQNEIYGELLHMQSGGVFAMEIRTNRILLINPAALDMFGFAPEEAETLTYERLLSRIVNREAIESFLKIRDSLTEPYAAEYEICHGEEHLFVLCHTRIITLANGEWIDLTSIMDITENKRFEQKLLQQSRHDALTGLANRGYGEYRIREMLQTEQEGMFFLFDVDKFKYINDTFGHSVGDRVLTEIAKTMQHVFSSHGVCMRLGGDEFAAYVTSVDSREEGERMIRHFFEHVEEITLPEMQTHKVTISLGAVLCVEDRIDDFDKLYQRADRVMYESKQTEGSSFRFDETTCGRCRT